MSKFNTISSPFIPTVFLLDKLLGKKGVPFFSREELSIAEQKGTTLLYGIEVKIVHNPQGKPSLLKADGTTLSLSISHNPHYLALLVAPPSFSVGVDIEPFRTNIKSLAPRFLSERELLLAKRIIEKELDTKGICNETVIYTQFWCAKEAAYKALSLDVVEVDFRKFYEVVYLSEYKAEMIYNGSKAINLIIDFYHHPSYCLAYTILE